MRIKLKRDIERLKRRVIELGTMVEERFRLAVKSVECRDAELAKNVIEGDGEIDQLEVDVEEECLKILALHQPVADDLRYIVAVLKMNNDLERIGDLAVNIAQRSLVICSHKGVRIPFDYFTMCERVDSMLRNALDSLVNMDVELAYKVCADDDDVDVMKNAIRGEFSKSLDAHTGDADPLVDLFLISRHLERIGDHATNIAEDVIYTITGQIHRHRGGEFADAAADPDEDEQPPPTP